MEHLVAATQPYSIVDLFSCVGGLTHGFVLEGLRVEAGIDSDDSCRYAYERNNGARFICSPVEDLTPAALNALFRPRTSKILIGCAPCQPFSRYSHSRKSPDDRWRLLSAFADLIEAIQPDIVSMENVPSLVTFRGGATYRTFVARLERTYKVRDYIVDCPQYGIPQQRKRLVLFASKYGEIELEDPPHSDQDRPTVRAAIGALPPITAGEICPTDILHRASSLSPLNLRRIRQSRPGGTWRDWDPELITCCHSRPSGKSYPSVYGRMSWEEPAPTITTQFHGYGSGRFGHPDQDRAISLREAALLQTFPAEYKFVEPGQPVHVSTIARHIGNAVPVELGRVIARSIKRHIEENRVGNSREFDPDSASTTEIRASRKRARNEVASGIK